jgi:mannose-6-phosphate isomerase-like protein (cupin superfamily)
MTASLPRSATYAAHYEQPPQQEGPGCRTWLTRGANFVVAVSEVRAGAVLERTDNPDEYFVFLPANQARITAGADSIDANAETLTIVPPGASRIEALGDGHIVRVFSRLNTDLLDACPNAGIYADGAPEVAPLVSWPDPVDGFRLRHYVLADHVRPDSNMRIFRSCNLMVNVLNKRTTPRDPAKLSPHSHTDFEQASLAIQGTYTHHLRWPWTPDMNQWRDDEHVTVGSPSVTVIPAKVLHTSANVSEGDCWLVDIFGPPRMDFSSKPGMVCNADDYPMPLVVAPS